ncbi:proton-coupled amino acid transporter-like protein pathetic isoform X2 [Lycorma delicatula]
MNTRYAKQPENMVNTKTFFTMESITLTERHLYNPFQHREVENPTKDHEALIHLLKGSLGSGILAMPMAFQNAGLWFGLIASLIVGFITTYCTHVFVKCGHILCQRKMIPSVGFKQIAELAFQEGPPSFKKYSKLAGIIVDASLVTELLGCCSAYVIMVSRNLKQVTEHYTGESWDLRFYILVLLPPLICLNLIRNLKRLTPVSMISNVLFFIGLAVTYFYIFSDLPSTSERPSFSSWEKLPTFFGTTIFALEGIGVVMPLENNMKNPQHFLGCPGVLNIGSFIIISLYILTGFFGYLKYGSNTKANITFNLPTDELLGQGLKLIISVGVLFSFSLLFFLAMTILFGAQNNKETKLLHYYFKRITILIITVIIAAIFPNLGPFLTLIGALSLSIVGLILPPILEVLIYSKSPGLGSYYWRLWKNIPILLFGITGLITGTMVAIKEMIDTFDVVED